MRTVIVIPARYGSSRLPGKPLADIHGKPMVQHVFERACLVPDVEKVVVATDDQRVADAVVAFGGNVVLTSADHVSGTDRLVEVMNTVDADLYVNLQGDEPLIRPEDIALLVEGMRSRSRIQVGTLCHPISAEEASNPNCVKVVLSGEGEAMYFSRSPIPYAREASTARYLKHVGVYAYRRDVLERYSQLPQSMLEQTEVLEQLRLMDAGIRLHAFEVAPTGPGVDTPNCLERVRAIMAGAPEPVSRPLLAGVKLVITDVDGVLTDGGIYYDADGECHKRFHVRDGLGIKMLQECGVRVAVVSGRDSATLRKRVADLDVSLTRFGVKDKAHTYLDVMEEAGVSAVETACIGDDSIDLPGFSVCGTSFAVADAPSYVKRLATHTLEKKGGEGAFREVSDRILGACGHEKVFASHQGFAQVMHRMAQ
jgi:3-deoxy-D-manno-octulosonate 8-phosphate phosphatase (KDO 8-P phosphatase)